MLSEEELRKIVTPLINSPRAGILLGEGGSGTVYKIGNYVVKMMRLVVDSDIEVFREEVEVWEKLHAEKSLRPYIPYYLGSILIDRPRNLPAYLRDSVGCIVQTYEPVMNMADYVDQYKERSTFLEFSRGQELFRNLIRAFAELHEAGYIHRDIKTLNILIRTEGDTTMPIIIDFGLVCKIPCVKEHACLGENNAPMGSEYYLVPDLVPTHKREVYHGILPIHTRPTFLEYIQDRIMCRRKRRQRYIRVQTSKNTVRGVYTIATDNYALSLVLDDLFEVISWEGHVEQKMEAKEQILRLKYEIIPYLASSIGKKRENVAKEAYL